MRYSNDDELDRALFAIPLEEPPADLRASILAATIYRPAVVPAPFKLWEAWALGAAVAVAVWLCVLIASGAADFTIASIQNLGSAALAELTQPVVLLWTAIGGALAAWLSQAPFISQPVPYRPSRR
ncbi:MAG: hypothetical protein M3R35_00930 [Candidatus Eremiobacteraeota bacterium]|nr:hypothetical protein [Candidatus Eremiobacteraeota bacterium]